MFILYGDDVTKSFKIPTGRLKDFSTIIVVLSVIGLIRVELS